MKRRYFLSFIQFSKCIFLFEQIVFIASLIFTFQQKSLKEKERAGSLYDLLL